MKVRLTWYDKNLVTNITTQEARKYKELGLEFEEEK